MSDKYYLALAEGIIHIGQKQNEPHPFEDKFPNARADMNDPKIVQTLAGLLKAGKCRHNVKALERMRRYGERGAELAAMIEEHCPQSTSSPHAQ